MPFGCFSGARPGPGCLRERGAPRYARGTRPRDTNARWKNMKHIVITMAREYASGGSEIARMVADELGIPLYNKELITIAAKRAA